jgi:hypothetical protein
MNADALEIILNNTNAYTAKDVRARVARMLTEAEALPGMVNNHPHPDLETAKEVGEVVRAMVLEYAAREYNLSDGDSTLTAMIFSTTMDHIDWAEVGRYYYVTAEA